MAINPASLAAGSGLLDGLTGFTGLGTPSLNGARVDSGGDVSDVFGLGRDDFFKLFLAQLRNQDPTQPMDDKEFLAQLALFSLIDTMQEVKKALGGTQLAQASSLIGKRVEGPGVDGLPLSGVVDLVVQDGSGLALVVGDRAIRADAVSTVATTTP